MMANKILNKIESKNFNMPRRPKKVMTMQNSREKLNELKIRAPDILVSDVSQDRERSISNSNVPHFFEIESIRQNDYLKLGRI
jgi:hypothetical protein